MAFKDRLKEARLQNGLTQEQLAAKIGVAKSTLTGYERGNSEPDMSKIAKMIEALNIDANYLWQDEIDVLKDDPPITQYEKALLKKYRRLDSGGKKSVNLILNNEIDRLEEQNGYPDIEEELERYRKQLLAEKKGTVSTVSLDRRNA